MGLNRLTKTPASGMILGSFDGALKQELNHGEFLH